MAHAPLRTSRLPRTWLPAILISVIISACCAAGLYVLLAQQDRSLVTQRNAAMVMATEQSARAMARTVAWFGESASLKWLVPAVKIAGGIVLILFATVLFLTVIPVSANGDYIAAGC